MEEFIIVSWTKLSKSCMREYNLENEKETKTEYYTDKKNRLCKCKEDEYYKIWSYTTKGTKILKKIKEDVRIPVEGRYACLFEPKTRWWIPHLCVIIIGIITTLLVWKNPEVYIARAKLNITGEAKEKEEIVSEDQDIIYQGFPNTFVFNKETRTLSIKNADENKDKYLIGVMLLKDNKVIYSTNDNVIESGKYINVDLYKLLGIGIHKITIIQYGYKNHKNHTRIGTSAKQEVHIFIKKG